MTKDENDKLNKALENTFAGQIQKLHDAFQLFVTAVLQQLKRYLSKGKGGGQK